MYKNNDFKGQNQFHNTQIWKDHFLENSIANLNPLSKLKLERFRLRSDEWCKLDFNQKVT